MKKLFFFVLVILSSQACFDTRQAMFRENYKDVNALIHQQSQVSTVPYLKAHMKDGSVYIFSDTWREDSLTKQIAGTAKYFDFNRRLVSEGEFVLSLDSVALFETNSPLQNRDEEFSSALRLLTTTNLIITTICLTYPKACFGSCPTFYLHPDENFHYASAESFSNAIAPSLEYTDIDALGNVNVGESSFQLTMKNEALETHCVNSLELYAVPVAEGRRTYQSGNHTFFSCSKEHLPVRATANEGSILRELSFADKLERFSVSDSFNMASKEEIELEYRLPDNHSDSLGLLLDFRQSIMTTYLIYNAIAYMGDEVGDVFAKMENGAPYQERLKNGIQKILGGIEVYVKSAGYNWEYQGTFYETGPIAINTQLLPFPVTAEGKNINVKLRLNKGLWRIDRAVLTEVINEIQPEKYTATRIRRNEDDFPKAMAQLADPARYLISYPGDSFTMIFDSIPRHTEMDMFLVAGGYYWEWMRDYWLKEKNMSELRKMILRPAAYLREQAGTYKKYEKQIEEDFWNSRIDGNLFTKYED